MNGLIRDFAASTPRRTLSVSLVLLVAGAATAALAFACSPNANIALSSSQGSAGSTVTVSGAAFAAGPVSISVAGQSVGTATGPNFSSSVTVPQLAPGVYTVRAVGKNPDGTFAGQNADTFEVTGPAPTSTTGAGSDPARGAAPAPAATRQSAGSVTSGKAPRGERGTNPRGERSAGRGDARAVASPTAPAKAISDSQVARTRSGRAVFAGSVPAKRRGSDGEAARRQSTAVSKESSARSAKLPSLASPAGGAAPDDGPGSQLGIGVALLALGLAVPLAGFLVADVRRRRARVNQSHRS